MHRAFLLCALMGVMLWGPEVEAARRASSRQSTQNASGTLARRAAVRASLWVGLPSLRAVSPSVNDDCSGLANLAYRKRGLSLLPERPLPGENGVAAIYRKAQSLGSLHSKPRPGDLVFFRETYDRNRDGRRNDGLTHIGVVERVERDGTVTFVHRVGGGVKRSKLHLHQPALRRDAKGQVLNDYLRRTEKTVHPRLAGELLAGFATVDQRWFTSP
ncbi:C40 family peptidase [Archangium lansingense]|uniref:NlpC/P60 family protein n=1 Tax=Archangium lansingense TaxID=2995310 RepID=A0ABT4AKG7_9BACT|nr:CHAP domain-containing protein [Archangium lansinium]MCY1082135.1 NlpC/P60 family protein [Archangium lansinium]